MSDEVARAALSRMNMCVVALAPHCATFMSDLHQLARADADEARKAAVARRQELAQTYGFQSSDQQKPFAFANGIAIIPITGTLINRFGQSWGYVTGYNFIRSQLALAMADDDVKGIIYDVNSYGGEAAGCFELSEEIRKASSVKPSLAMIDSNCYSAGYALASAAKKVVCIPSGGAGSIGVVVMHVDMSKMLADWGYKVTFIHAGDHKVDGNPFEPLPASVKKDIQASVDKLRVSFASLVATNRGMDEVAVMQTEARCYSADDALALGLIDAVASPLQAVQAFFAELPGSTPQLKLEAQMPNEETKPGADEASTQQAAINKATADARAAERARMSGITGCEEAKGRESLANHLAMNTDMTVDAAKAILAASPKAEPPKTETNPANPFAAAMDATKNPNVGADNGTAAAAGGEQDTSESRVKGILAAQSQATGRKLPA
jgi:capsid assembly protease